MLSFDVCGCTDPLASNYDSLANTDDGSCVYSTVCSEPTPTGLFTSNIVHNRATINWDNMNDANCTVDQYRIKYREVGTNSWSQKNMCTPLGSCTWACNKTDKLILGLNPGTTYEYQIRAWYCGAGNSAWSSLNTFTTLDACPNVGNLTVSTPNTTKATFNWDASNGNYEFVRIKSRVDSISNPSNADWFNVGGAGVSYPTFTKNKNNLTPGETYRAQARTWCDPNGGAYKSDTWTPLVYWTQPTIRIEGGESIANLEVYPNPSKDIFNISFTSESIQDLRVRVLSIVGEELIVEDLQQFIGEYTKKVSLNENAKGIYFLEIETKDGIINKKLILQ
ncbi:fibronectin type III domain-containing protein [Flavobacteriales bacterium]|nr:fibronectin type III domain-containing protein [Flavobacteriales bacterium]